MAFSSVKQSEFNTIKIFIILKYSIINNSLSKFKFTTGVNARKNMHNSCRKKPVSEAGAGRSYRQSIDRDQTRIVKS